MPAKKKQTKRSRVRIFSKKNENWRAILFLLVYLVGMYNFIDFMASRKPPSPARQATINKAIAKEMEKSNSRREKFNKFLKGLGM